MSPPVDDDFTELYRAHGGRLVVQLYAYTQDLALAEDVVQEAFCRALARWSRLAGYDDPIGWVRRVAWNLATSNWRRTRRGRDVADRLAADRFAVGPAEEPSPNRIVLLQALAGLPMSQRRAVIMYYLGDMTVAEVAEIEGTTENTMKQRLHRARAALADKLLESRSEVGHV
jgi:RNA polymerase sigma-70 factor (ECF subfamily)